MNIVANTYLATRKQLNRGISPRPCRQARLTEQFLKEWKSREGIDPGKLLDDTLAFTAESIPYYKNYFAQNPDRDSGLLSDWPILTRDTLWNHSADLQADCSNKWRRWTHASGGSTGRPVVVVHDEYFAAKAQALRRLCDEIFFEGPHYNKLILWGMSDEVERQIAKSDTLGKRVKDGILAAMGLKTSHINTFEFTREKFEQCVHLLDHQRPRFIFGYAGSVYELAKYIDENAINLAHTPRIIGTTAQMLHPFMRERIEKVFRCRVCDHYGSREVGPVAWQHGSEMYFPGFFTKIEVIDANGESVECGQQGRILLTTLHNYSMPLIRYDIGDLGVLGESKFLRGYPFATLDRISGRSSEEFTNPRGSRICAPFFINLFYYRPWLDQFYIIQRDYDLIEIMYIPKITHEEVPEAELEDINHSIKKVMTMQCRIVWKQVSEMPTTKAGKRLFIRSEI